jgi:hypothetical protein
MLYLVITTPYPSKPEDVKNARLEFRSWIKNLKSKNVSFKIYPLATPLEADELLK